MVNRITIDDEYIKLVHLLRVGSHKELDAFVTKLRKYSTYLALKICRDVSDKGDIPYNRGYVAGIMAVCDLINECIEAENRIRNRGNIPSIQ